jgi:hypothetical protein
MNAMNVANLARRTGPEHSSAVHRLAGARNEERRLDAACTAAAGTGAEPLAQERLSAGHAGVAALEQWLHWVDEGESIAPWADGEWAPTEPPSESAGIGSDLRIIRERIRRGETELSRAVAGTAERIEGLERLAAAAAGSNPKGRRDV